ncbi:putative hydratase protein [Stappia sp. 22II-S9-Z10]|nr:putative hydratase protein [Stappia sp. 22II-S9-Z10]
MPTPLAETFAAALIEARRTGRRAGADAIAAFAEATPADVMDVQALVADACGPVGAWKTAPGEGRPMIAPILAPLIRPSGAVFGTDEIGSCGIELEIGFRLDRPLPDPSAPDFSAALKAAVTPVVVIEVVDGRMDGFTTAPAPAKLADNQSNGGLVVGETGVLASNAPVIRLLLGDTVAAEGATSPPGGDAYVSLENFVRHVGDFLGGFQPGQILITGSLNGMPFIEPGTRVEGHIAGLGDVSLEFAAR